MLKEKASIFNKIDIILDLLITAVSFVLAYYLTDILKGSSFSLDPISNYLWMLYIILPLWGAFIYHSGVYRSHRVETLFQSCWQITKSLLYLGIVLIVANFLINAHISSRMIIILFLVINEFLLIAKKLFIKTSLHIIRRKGYNYRTVLLVGTGKRAQEFIKTIIRHKEWGMKIVGLIDRDPMIIGKSICGIHVIGVLENIPEILHNSEIDEVVFIVPRNWLNFLEDTLIACEEMGIKVRLAGDFFSHKIAKTYMQNLNGQSFLTYDPTPHSQEAVMTKRAFDVVLASLLLVFMLPLLLLIALVIKVTSGSPILFKQTRCGLNGKRFTVFKFRTMINGAESLKQQLVHMNEMSGPVFKIKNDPRITRVGKILRKTSLDELPQLINILKGDMSLVGPRPPLPSEVKKYDRWQRRKLSMKPGITCLWQINGRNRIDFEKWMKLDLEYIDNWSLGLDMLILLKTIPAVLKGTGI